MKIAFGLHVAAALAIVVTVAGCGAGSALTSSDCRAFSTSGNELLITEVDTARCFSAQPGSTAQLRLSYGWSEPKSSGGAIQLTPIEYFRDPGFSAWVVRALKSGTSTISASRLCPASDCPQGTLTFKVTIAVSR
jgi:hypothetical protein